MEEFKPNSHKYKEEQQDTSENRQKQEKIVNGPVKVKKKSGVSKLADVFISEDAGNVKSYILLDVIVPAIKNTIEDIVTNGIRMVLRGSTGDRKGTSYASKVSYNSYYNRRDERPSATRTRTGYSYDDIIFDNRGEAEAVLDRLDELIDTYKMASVADLYDLVGITGNFTDNKYGWTNIRSARVERVREGYMIVLPKVLPLD